MVHTLTHDGLFPALDVTCHLHDDSRAAIESIQADFVHVDAEVSLLHAASLFQNRHVKFLPIIVPGSATVLALISHVEILEVRT